MSVQLEAGAVKRFRGLSSDIKPGREINIQDGENAQPQAIGVGSTFTETDTGEKYIWRGQWPWVRQEQTIEAMFEDLMQVNLQMLQVMREIKRATAIQANGAFNAHLNTD